MPENHKVELTLGDLNDMFTAPDFDPFDPLSTDVSGIDYLVTYMKGRDIRDEDWELTVYLPAEQITPDLPQKMQDAIERYSRRQIESNDNEIKALRSDGLRTIPYSAILIGTGGAIIVAANFLQFHTAIQTLLMIIVINIYYLAGWWPVELLLFDPLEYRRLNNTHRAIIRMQKAYMAIP